MKEMLIFVDTSSNHNKFYYLELQGNEVLIEYGRVGSTAQKTSYYGGEKTFNKKKNEKLKKGYVVSQIDTNIIHENITIEQGNIMDIAMSQINTDDFSKLLIEKLVKQNIHNITENTKIKFDSKTGYFTTPLGVVTSSGIKDAISILNNIDNLISDNDKLADKDIVEFKKLNSNYFSIIPTKISDVRNINNLLITKKRVQQQLDICQALEDSIKIIDDEKQKKINELNSENQIKEVQKIFDTSVYKLDEPKEFKRIEKFFESSKVKEHGSTVNSYKIKNVYSVSLDKEEKAFRKDMKNIRELWHGTKVANLLSILKSGLLMPKYSPGSVTGYMFGQGLYFSDISTKSLNYCDGMYWNNEKSQGNIYMFIADVAMGNYQIPRTSTSKKPDSGYDSYWAQPGKSGIRNNEMIIFENNQIKLKYILELEKGK